MQQQSKQAVRDIPVSQIDPGNNDRKHFDGNALQDLATSIQLHGLAQPITVRPVGERFQIVAGERRFRAIRDILKWETAPCIVRELTDEQASAIMLAENTSRADLNPIEEAEAYQVRRDAFNWAQKQIAEVAGVSVERVKDRLALLTLVPEIQHLVKIGQFPLGHAKLLAELDNNRQRIALRVYSESKYMPLSRYKEVVNQLVMEQNQQTLFNLAEFMIQQANQEEPQTAKGRKARTGAPTRKDLPPVRYRLDDGYAAILDRYIHDLMQAGHVQEAGALGNVYNCLIAHNWTVIPAGALLPKVSDEQQPAGDVPDMRID